jgi:hypothetical protein
MSRKRAIALGTAGVVVALIGTLAVVWGANESKWSDTLGDLTERQRGLTKPVKIVRRPWPKAGQVNGAVLCLDDERDSELRLPKDPNRIWVDKGVKDQGYIVSLDTDGSGGMDVRIPIATEEMKYSDVYLSPMWLLFDTDMDSEQLASYMNKHDKALAKRSDESVMLSALKTVAADYEEAEDVLEAALVYQSLLFRGSFRLRDGNNVYRYDTDRNRVYLNRADPDSWFTWYLFVFDKDGAYLGMLLCTEGSRDKAFGIAKSMKRLKKGGNSE